MGCGRVLRGGDGVFEQIVGVDAAVDADDFHAGGDAGLEGGTADDGVADAAVFAELQADGVGVAGGAAAAGQMDGLGATTSTFQPPFSMPPVGASGDVESRRWWRKLAQS